MARDRKTKSEALFEQFLSDHRLQFVSIPEAESPRPDYAIGGGTSWGPIFFEVKELKEDADYKQDPLGLSKRKPGEHIRRKISESRKQIQYGAMQGIPSVLLIYNAIDPVSSMFGTERHDFISAMHGDWTLIINTENGNIIDAGHGRNRSFRQNHNTSFAALGHFLPHAQSREMTVRLFPNEHAAVPLPSGLPPCFEIIT